MLKEGCLKRELLLAAAEFCARPDCDAVAVKVSQPPLVLLVRPDFLELFALVFQQKSYMTMYIF